MDTKPAQAGRSEDKSILFRRMGAVLLIIIKTARSTLRLESGIRESKVLKCLRHNGSKIYKEELHDI